MVDRLGQRVPQRLGVSIELLLGPAQVHRQADEPLLRTVVHVALELSQRRRFRGHRRGLLVRQHRDRLAHLGNPGQQDATEPGLGQRAKAHHRTEG